MFRHENITALAIQAAAETLGLWDTLQTYSLPVREQNGLYHTNTCNQAQAPSLKRHDVLLGDMEGTWCVCLVERHAYYHGVVDLRPQERYLQLALTQYYLTQSERAKETQPDFTTWVELWELSAGPTARSLQGTGSGWLPSAEQLHTTSYRQLYWDHLAPVVQALVRCSTTQHREQAQKELLARHGAHDGTLDTSELLVGGAELSPRDAGYDHPSEILLAMSLVHWGEGGSTCLYRLPQWAHAHFQAGIGHSNEPYFPAVPWRDTLPIETIARLWEPWGTTHFRQLSVAIKAAQLV